MTAEPAANPPADTPTSSWSMFLPRRGVWITWVISLTLVAIVRYYVDQLDYSVVNGLTGGGIFACGLALWIWSIWHSEFSFFTRRAIFLGSLGLLVLAICCVRANFDGSLVPHFRFVWNSPPDRLLGAPPQNVAIPPTEERPQVVDEVGFPQFLGPDRNARLPGPKLLTDWKKNPPKKVWRQPIGAGWSAFAAHSGRAVTLEQRGDDEWIICYDVPTGKTVWSHSVPGRHFEVMGGVGPRSTPTIDDGRVYTLGANGHLHCLDLFSGEVIWEKQLLEIVGVKPGEDQNSILWGRSNSPLVYFDMVIVPGGGSANGPKHSLVAFDKMTGDVRWKGGDSQASYSSPSVAKLLGKEQILIVNEASVAGHDPASGVELWNFTWFGSSTSSASVSQAQAVTDHQVFISKGYGGGMKLLEITYDEPANKWSVTEEVKNSAAMKTKFTNAAILGDYAYALSDSILECIDWRTGESQWKRGRYGQGQLLAVGDVLLIQCESGEVALVEASPEKYSELTRFQAIEGITWNNPCVYGKLLLVRNAVEAACYELPVE